MPHSFPRWGNWPGDSGGMGEGDVCVGGGVEGEEWGMGTKSNCSHFYQLTPN